MGLDKQVRSY